MLIKTRFLSHRLSYREWMPPNPAIVDPDELENIWNVNNSCWLMVGSIMQQGCDILPRFVLELSYSWILYILYLA